MNNLIIILPLISATAFLYCWLVHWLTCLIGGRGFSLSIDELGGDEGRFVLAGIFWMLLMILGESFVLYLASELLALNDIKIVAAFSVYFVSMTVYMCINVR